MPQAQTSTARSTAVPNKEVQSADPSKIENKSSGLSVGVAELKKITVETPEKRKEKISLSETAVNTLAYTLVSQFETVDKMKKATPPLTTNTLQDKFYENFQKMYTGSDLSDAEKLETMAKEFLSKGGAEVRLAIKLMEWEQATYQAATGRHFSHEGYLHAETEVETDETTVVSIKEDGTTQVEKKEPGWLQKTFGKRTLRFPELKYKITGGKTADISTNALLSQAQKDYLKQMGYSDGTLNADQIKSIDQRMAHIFNTISEVYIKTGMPASNVEPNMIKSDLTGGRTYSSPRTPYFIGEEGATSGNLRADIEAQGDKIADEVKTKVEKELKEAKEKAKTSRAEQTAETQLDGAINKRKESIMSEEKKRVEKAQIDHEIARLQAETNLFIRQSELLNEIPVVTITRDETRQKVIDRQGTLRTTSGGAVDLIVWSSPRSPDSWIAWERRLQYYKQHLQLIEQNKESIRKDLAEKRRNITELYTQVVTRGNQQIQVVDHNNPFEAEVTALSQQLTDLNDQIYTRDFQGSGRSLSQLIMETNEAYTVRKEAVDANSDVVNPYLEAENSLTEKQQQQVEIGDKITGLASSENSVNKINSKIERQKEKLKHLELPDTRDLNEIDALTALKQVLPSTGREEREKRLVELKRGSLPLEIIAGSEWEKFPPAILQAAQVIFGNDVLLPYPDNDYAKQVQTLMRSKKYLPIFINAISNLGTNVNAPDTNGQYSDINNVIGPFALLRLRGNWDINSKVINEIVDNMRKEALGIK